MGEGTCGIRVPKSYKLSHEKGTCHYCPFLLLRAVSWEGLSQTRRPTALWLQGQESPTDRNRAEARRRRCVQLLRGKRSGAWSASEHPRLLERPQGHQFSCPVSLERLAAKEEKGFRACLPGQEGHAERGQLSPCPVQGGGGRSQSGAGGQS